MKIKYFIIYLSFGMLAALASGAFPILYKFNNFNTAQISFLITLSMIASLFQPLVALLATKIINTLKIVKILLLTIIISTLIMFNTSNFTITCFSVLLFFIARNSIFPVFDSYTSKQVSNFGKIRMGASIGYGIAMILLVIFLNSLNLSYKYISIFTTFCALMSLSIIRIRDFKVCEKSTSNVLKKTNKLSFILLLIYNASFYGFVVLRLSYQTPYLLEYNFSTNFIALSSFIMVIFEMLLLPFYSHLFSKFNKIHLLIFISTLSIFQMILLILFPNTISVLIALMLHGFMMSIFIPSYSLLLSSVLSLKDSVKGFVISTAVQSISVGIINMFIISSLYNKSETIDSVNYIITTMYLISIIPLLILLKKYSPATTQHLKSK